MPKRRQQAELPNAEVCARREPISPQSATTAMRLLNAAIVQMFGGLAAWEREQERFGSLRLRAEQAGIQLQTTLKRTSEIRKQQRKRWKEAEGTAAGRARQELGDALERTIDVLAGLRSALEGLARHQRAADAPPTRLLELASEITPALDALVPRLTDAHRLEESEWHALGPAPRTGYFGGPTKPEIEAETLRWLESMIDAHKRLHESLSHARTVIEDHGPPLVEAGRLLRTRTGYTAGKAHHGSACEAIVALGEMLAPCVPPSESGLATLRRLRQDWDGDLRALAEDVNAEIGQALFAQSAPLKESLRDDERIREWFRRHGPASLRAAAAPVNRGGTGLSYATVKRRMNTHGKLRGEFEQRGKGKNSRFHLRDSGSGSGST